jgi:biotin carboxylase
VAFIGQVNGDEMEGCAVCSAVGDGLHVLLIGSGEPVPSRLRARFPGVRTTVMTSHRSLGDLKDVAANTRVIGISRDAPADEWLALASTIHDRDPYHHIGAFGEPCQDHAARIAQRLGLRFHSTATIAAVYDKVIMRERLLSAGVDDVVAAEIDSREDVEQYAAKHGYPFVLKPRSGTASVGVAVVRRQEDIEPGLSRAVGTGRYGGRSVLAEPLLTGSELTVEAFSENGAHRVLAVTEKIRTDEWFVDIAHVTPARLAESDRKLVVEFVLSALDALGVEDGATHTEVILTGSGPKMIETHTRCAGDDIPLLIKDTIGIDPYELVARQTVGERVLPDVDAALAEPPVGAAAVWFGAPRAEGTVVEITGVDEAMADPRVRDLTVAARAGDHVNGIDLTDNFSRIVHCRAVGADPESAVAAAREAVARVHFVVATTMEPARS